LKMKDIKGMDVRALRLYRSFYFTYPQFRVILPKELCQTSAIQIRGTLSAEFDNSELVKDNNLNPDFLLSHLNFSHFIELIRVANPTERLFYEVETIKNNWSVRELKRAINTSLALRI